ADGRESVRLGNSRLVYSVVRRGPDGKVDHQCVEGADGVHAHLNHRAPGGAQEKARHDHR
ncbi:post-PEP-CTERM-1 domain-containing protein, partial [Acinetobacter baumannii]|uniref:post-PEP-CTERM-1 domain-containing protein n=1 Tax=Acinetobacter baumannii TaxID=470 RepID=UPI0035BBB067